MKIQFDAPPVSAQQSNGLSVRYAASKRSVPRWRWALILALLLAPPLFFLIKLALSVWVQTVPAYVMFKQETLRAGMSGQLEQLVLPGQPVHKGDTLFVVRPATVPTPSAAPVIAAVDPSLPERQAVARAALALAGQVVEMRQAKVATVRRLVSQGAATAAEQAAADAQLVEARADMIGAQGDLATLGISTLPAPRPQPTPPAVPVLHYLAPAEGTVSRLLSSGGTWVTPDSEVLVLKSAQPPYVQAYLDPASARYAAVGRRAKLKFLDGDSIPAEVVNVDTEAQRPPANLMSSLTERAQAIVVTLKPDVPLPAKYAIHMLPLEVRFDYVW